MGSSMGLRNFPGLKPFETFNISRPVLGSFFLYCFTPTVNKMTHSTVLLNYYWVNTMTWSSGKTDGAFRL